ncbi:MAG: putative DNA-binding domain-containing protein [Notoacmeibacter sp.]|nr:putative DNA-binding domain-containing protein [Notoacmeibacter sp.]
MSRSSLADIQSRLQQAILDANPSPGALDLIAPPVAGDAATRLETYRSAYRIRLVGILRDDFDALHQFLGDEDFDTLANAYVEAHPSHTRNARWYGEAFAQFARATAPFAGHPVIGELAALQWALGTAFDAPDASVATLSDLAGISPNDVAGMRLTMHPSAAILPRRTNAADIFSAIRSGGEAIAPDEINDGSAVLVWRSESRAHYRILAAEEAMLANEAAGGASFALLCEMAAMMDDPDNAALRVAGVLRGWLDDGVLSGLRPQP